MPRWAGCLVAMSTLAATVPTSAHAQDYVTSTWLYLRRSPSDTAARLRTLPPGDTLHTREVSTSRAGWLAVRTTDGRAGWVAERYVHSLAAIAAAAATSIITAPGGRAFDRIDPTWDKPPLRRSTIRVQGGTLRCGPIGDAANDDGTNLNKSRADAPASSYLVTVDAIRALPDTALWRFTHRRNWTAADSALVLPYEGIPVTVEGFFEVVKPQQTSAPTGGRTVGETPNCHSWDERDTDWHVSLVADPSETEEQSVVIEPTPRSKRNNRSWTPAVVSRLAVRRTPSPSARRFESEAQRVRVTGFLLLDPVHPTHIRGKCQTGCSGRRFYRATLWEVHPVTRIEVLRGGQWVNLNDVPPP
jgi:Bacterial SH3 domain